MCINVNRMYGFSMQFDYFILNYTYKFHTSSVITNESFDAKIKVVPLSTDVKVNIHAEISQVLSASQQPSDCYICIS